MQNPENFLDSRLPGGGFFHAIMEHRCHTLFEGQGIYLVAGGFS